MMTGNMKLNPPKILTNNTLRRRIPTTDAVRPSQDAILSAVRLGSREEREMTSRTGPLYGMDLGLRWTGDLKPVGEAVARVIDALRSIPDKVRAADALAGAVSAIANFGNGMGSDEAHAGPMDSLIFGGGVKPNPSTSEGAMAEVNMNRKTGDSINAKNREFWGQRPIY
jgi:hypothetical protein